MGIEGKSPEFVLPATGRYMLRASTAVTSQPGNNYSFVLARVR
jgi:hypothetical protein